MPDPAQPEEPSSPTAALDRVLEGPKAAREAAVEVLGRDIADPHERAEALWALGKAALEDNRISDAVNVLEQGVLAVEDDDVAGARIRCTLALVLSKDGRPKEAAAMLDAAEPLLDGADLARLRNQRGMLLTDAGRFSEALDELIAAADGLATAGDTAAEARTRCNLGAVASMMGRLDDAERWFADGRDLAAATGQALVVAGTEGNLGYVAGRRGDFPTALRWYEAAREGFAALGGVELSVATLETDYARTLIDAGLAGEAVEAGGRALASARAGGNQTLVAQSHLLIAEALIALGRIDGAGAHIDQGRRRFVEVGARHWALQADRLWLSAAAAPDPEKAAKIASEMLAAGWEREAIEAAVVAAGAALDQGSRELVRPMVAPFLRPTGGARGSERADLHHLHALQRLADGDRRGALAALRAGLRALDEQRSFVAAPELEAGIARRAERLARRGTELALARGRASDVLRWADRWRGLSFGLEGTRNFSHDPAVLERLRSALVDQEGARLSGGDPGQFDHEIRACEDQLRSAQRTRRGRVGHPGAGFIDPAQVRERLGDATLVQFVEAGDGVAAVVVTRSRCRLVHLREDGLARGLAERQAEALRRVNRSTGSARMQEAALTELLDSSGALDEALIAPLRLEAETPVAVVPTGVLHGVAWSACPTFRERAIIVVPSARSWLRGPARRPGGNRVSLIGGPDLATADAELRELAEIHLSVRPTVVPRATAAVARAAFEESALVHVAAHGSFRADNPAFSAFVLADGPLNVFDLEQLREVPQVVVLAACDAAAAAVRPGDELMGTTAALLRLGVHNVVAPGSDVSDEHVVAFMADFHRGLAAGSAPARALADARRQGFARATPGDVGVAAAFATYGTTLDPGVGTVAPDG